MYHVLNITYSKAESEASETEGAKTQNQRVYNTRIVHCGRFYQSASHRSHAELAVLLSLARSSARVNVFFVLRLCETHGIFTFHVCLKCHVMFTISLRH